MLASAEANSAARCRREIDQRTYVADDKRVIGSPSHIRNMVPPSGVIAADMRKNMPGSLDVHCPAPSSPTAMP